MTFGTHSISAESYASIEDFIATEVATLEALQLPCPPLTHVLIEKLAPREGLWLEFGVWKGYSINIIAENIDGIVHGFDSFVGLPEDWRSGSEKGRYSVDGNLPDVRDNVRLLSGWFDETLPKFLEDHPGNVALLHVDCDIYSSTKTVLTLLRERIVPGTIVIFDELFNYPEYREHELKAFYEFQRETSLRFQWIGMRGSIELNPNADFERQYYDGNRGFGLKVVSKP